MLTSVKINHDNFKFLLLMANVYCHVNFKVQQSCSNIPVKFKLLQLCQSNSVHFQIQFVSVNGQVAGSTQEQLVPVNLSLFSVKQPVRIQEQLVPILLVFAERLVQIQEQLMLSMLFPVSQVTSSCPRTACAFYFVFFQPSN